MATQRKCPTCRAGQLTDGTTEHTAKVGARTFVATLPARLCANCDEAIIGAEHLRAFERALERALVDVGADDGAALRYVRKGAGLTGVELARLLGVAAETVSRWENGAQTPDRATVALLGALALDALDGRTTTRDRLDALARPREDAPGRVVLEVYAPAA